MVILFINIFKHSKQNMLNGNNLWDNVINEIFIFSNE